MFVSYRVNSPITVVMQEQGHCWLRELPTGSMLLCTSSQPDRNHMVDGTYKGISVLIFARDLEDDSERIEVDQIVGIQFSKV